MNKIGLFCIMATIAIAAATDDHDHVSRHEVYLKSSPGKIVYVEKEPEYRKPITYEIVKKVPEYKKTVYEYRQPEEKKVLVKVVKEDDREYVVRPSYEPKKNVLLKILDRNH